MIWRLYEDKIIYLILCKDSEFDPLQTHAPYSAGLSVLLGGSPGPSCRLLCFPATTALRVFSALKPQSHLLLQVLEVGISPCLYNQKTDGGSELFYSRCLWLHLSSPLCSTTVLWSQGGPTGGPGVDPASRQRLQLNHECTKANGLLILLWLHG